MKPVSQLLYLPVFQMAYVTTDMDEAIRLFDTRYGVGDFMRRSDLKLSTLSGGEMLLDLALAFVGPTMVEIIAPTGGDDHLYRQILPVSDFALRHHHIGIRLHSDEEWAAMREQAGLRGQEIVLEVETPTTRALYIDTLDQLGHYVEYLHYFDEAGSSLPHIPQNLA